MQSRGLSKPRAGWDCVGPGDHRAHLCDCRQRFKALQYLRLSEIPPKVPELIDLCMNGKPV